MPGSWRRGRLTARCTTKRGMASTPVAPGDPLFIYDVAQRAAATRAGAPTPRMTGPSAPLVVNLAGPDNGPEPAAGANYLWWDNDARALMAARWGGDTEKIIDPQTLLALLEGNQSLTVDSRSTVGRALAMCRRHKTPEAFTLQRVMTLASSLPTSSRMPILTDALSAKFWMPTAGDPRSLTAWAQALDLADLPALDAMVAMRRMVCSQAQSARMTRIAKAEAYMLASARFSGLTNACSTYSSAESINDMWAVVCCTDPLLSGRGVLEGTVAHLSPMTLEEQTFTAALTSPMKLRVGKEVVLMNADHTLVASSELLGLAVVGPNLIGTFSMPKPRSVQGRWVRHEVLHEQDLYATAKPFEGGGGSRAGRMRWTGKVGVEWSSGRKIPADIAAAGAPRP